MVATDEAIGAAGAPVRARLSATPLFRTAILKATHNGAVAGGVRRYGMRFGAGRFVAGETLDAAVVALRALNAAGFVCNTTILGEGVHDAATATAVTDQYIGVLDRIAAEQLRCNVALKLTHLGLDLGEETAFANAERVIAHAATLGNFVRMDMEESARVDATLRIYKKLRAAGHANTGTVLQSYLFRTAQDLTDLLPLQPNLRFVKGAYLEPPEIAFGSKAETDRSYVRLIERSLLDGGYTAIATHDERIIDHAIAFTEQRGIPRDRFHPQMLYGIRPDLHRRLRDQGYSVLIATPYGPEWYFFLMRRLAERPANLLFFFAKNVVKW